MSLVSVAIQTNKKVDNTHKFGAERVKLKVYRNSIVSVETLSNPLKGLYGLTSAKRTLSNVCGHERIKTYHKVPLQRAVQVNFRQSDSTLQLP